MSDANAKEAEATQICKEAIDQKAKMMHFCSTVQHLEEELLAEEKLIDDMHTKRDGGKAGDLLSKGLSARRQTIVELNKELGALVEGQNEISKKAAEHAGKMLGELEANSAQMKKDKTTNSLAMKFLKAANATAITNMKEGHDAALKTKEEEHHAAKSKLNKDHDKAKSDLNKKMHEQTDTHISAMSALSKQHEDKSTRMVSVNAKFLGEVQKFVDIVKSLLSKRAQYEGVFHEIETAMAHIGQELSEFSGHATVSPQAHSLHPHTAAGGGKARTGGNGVGAKTQEQMSI